MKKIVINGKFLCDRMQGIVRYAREIVTSLDEICDGVDVTLLIPSSTECDLSLKNIKTEKYGKHSGIKWEQRDLAKYMRGHKDCICLNLCNVAPIHAPAGVTVIHDVMYKVNPSHYTTLRNRLSRMWHCYQYRVITKRELAVLTVSEFSKNDLIKIYHKCDGKVYVVPSAWQHVKKFEENPDWQTAYPFLRPEEFYFSLSTLAKNKNGKWILEVAKNNPDAIFAIGGKYYETDDTEIPSNVHMLGFISDEDACSLIKNCKAFIHPSLYEGFGLPPLEALALGAEVVSSNTTSLPEVLGDSVHYIDPYDYSVDLDKLLKEPVADRQKVLDKFSWEKSAERLLDILKTLN
ncbi:MAG: glycosyltransferase family 4 protein [Clostridia bacterium]|nr:glycosyltransferase family 4 protein [Clostridia bacterium]